MHRQSIVLVVAGTAAACMVNTPTSSLLNQRAAGSYEAIDLGTLGGTSSQATGVNSRLQVVGVGLTATGESHAFLWENGAMRDLGTLGSSESAADNINDAGQVAGRSRTGGGELHAFLWSGGAMQDLGPVSDLTEVGPNRVTLNSSGRASWTTGAWPTIHAALWDGTTMVDLGTLGGSRSEAKGINDQGQVTGFSRTPGDSSTHPFLWSAGTMQDLGSLGGTTTRADASNSGGQVTGSGFRPAGIDVQGYAWLWDGTQLIDLGSLDIRYVNCSAASINNSGTVVGRCENRGFENPRPFVWQAGAGLRPLSPTYQTDPSQDVVAINPSGTVAGFRCVGRFDCDKTHTVVWLHEEFQDLGALTDTLNQQTSRPNAINAHGDVVGVAGTHAVLWRRVQTVADGLK